MAFKLLLNHQDAIDSHKSFYSEDFEVLPTERRCYFDIFPINIVTSFADFPGANEWDGIISTNGKKIVMTESKWKNPAEHKKVYEYSLDEIDSIASDHYGLTMTLKSHVKGLTKSKGNHFLKILIFFCTFGIAYMLQSFLFKGNVVDMHLKNDFNNEDKFKTLLNI